MRNPIRIATVTIALLSVAGPIPAENIDPDNDGSSVAWGENVGWINAEPSGDGGPGAQVSDFELSGWMWGENMGWINLSCQNDSSCGTVNYGVKNDGEGTLTGRAWSENAGWISFGGEVTIDPTTGLFEGEAWAENVGWIRFSGTNPVVYGVKTDWCQSTPAPPSGTPEILVAKSGDNALVDWSALPEASWYESVGGTLSALQASGDFSSATSICLGENVTSTSGEVPQLPPSGDGFWFLVRGDNCKGKGTYDSGGVNQVAPRDAAIAASGEDCP